MRCVKTAGAGTKPRASPDAVSRSWPRLVRSSTTAAFHEGSRAGLPMHSEHPARKL
jgi:hypothetical protein